MFYRLCNQYELGFAYGKKHHNLYSQPAYIYYTLKEIGVIAGM